MTHSLLVFVGQLDDFCFDDRPRTWPQCGAATRESQYRLQCSQSAVDWGLCTLHANMTGKAVKHALLHAQLRQARRPRFRLSDEDCLVRHTHRLESPWRQRDPDQATDPYPVGVEVIPPRPEDHDGATDIYMDGMYRKHFRTKTVQHRRWQKELE